MKYKYKVANTLIFTFFFKIHDSKKKFAKIAGFDVNFCTFDSLKFLYEEIFVNLDYYFLSDNENPTIIDCGSNIGISILFFKMLFPYSKVICFEPSDLASNCLLNNIKNNQLSSVDFHQVALSNKEGEIDFFFDDQNPGSLLMSTNKFRMNRKKTIVQSTKLSKFIDGPIDFLKIDVEGSENEILLDLFNENKLQFIRKIIIEYHHHLYPENDNISQTITLLEKSNYGYLVESSTSRPYKPGKFQDILLYAYNKNKISET